MTMQNNPIEPGTVPGALIYVPGRIVVFSWGYEQTNIDFFLITKRAGDYATLVEMTDRQVPTPHAPWLTGRVVAGEAKQGAKPFRRKVHRDRAGNEIGIAIKSYGWASLWDGSPQHWTGYGNPLPRRWEGTVPLEMAVTTTYGAKLEFPVVDIGQLSKQNLTDIRRMVRQGVVIKYVDYTFPRTKSGYALRDPAEPADIQAVQQSLRSLYWGSWRFVPEARDRVAARLKASLASELPPRTIFISSDNPDMKLAREMRARYRGDLKAGHTDAAEYWRGQAAAYFTGNPGMKCAKCGAAMIPHGSPGERRGHRDHVVFTCPKCGNRSGTIYLKRLRKSNPVGANDKIRWSTDGVDLNKEQSFAYNEGLLDARSGQPSRKNQYAFPVAYEQGYQHGRAGFED